MFAGYECKYVMLQWVHGLLTVGDNDGAPMDRETLLGLQWVHGLLTVGDQGRCQVFYNRVLASMGPRPSDRGRRRA